MSRLALSCCLLAGALLVPAALAQEGGWLTSPPPDPPTSPPTRPTPRQPPPSLETVRELARQAMEARRDHDFDALEQRCEAETPRELRELPLPRGTDQLTGVTPPTQLNPAQAHPWHEKALAALEEGSLVQVVTAVRAAYGAGLSRPEADRVLALALLKAEQPANGILHMRRAMEVEEERRPANFRALGKLYMLQGDTARAIRAFHDAVADDPEDDESHMMLAVAYDQARNSAKVLEHAQQAIRLDPGNKERLKPFIRSSNVSKRIGCIVSQVLRDAKYERITDERLEQYAEEIGEVLGTENLRSGLPRRRRPGPFAPAR